MKQANAKTAALKDSPDNTPVMISSESLAEAIDALEQTLRVFKLLAQHFGSGELLVPTTEFDERDA